MGRFWCGWIWPACPIGRPASQTGTPNYAANWVTQLGPTPKKCAPEHSPTMRTRSSNEAAVQNSLVRVVPKSLFFAFLFFFLIPVRGAFSRKFDRCLGLLASVIGTHAAESRTLPHIFDSPGGQVKTPVV